MSDIITEGSEIVKIYGKYAEGIAAYLKTIHEVNRPIQGFCSEHKEFMQDLFADGHLQCETCFVAKHEYQDEGLEVSHD